MLYSFSGITKYNLVTNYLLFKMVEAFLCQIKFVVVF